MVDTSWSNESDCFLPYASHQEFFCPPDSHCIQIHIPHSKSGMLIIALHGQNRMNTSV